jgi:hypothetical protein
MLPSRRRCSSTSPAPSANRNKREAAPFPLALRPRIPTGSKSVSPAVALKAFGAALGNRPQKSISPVAAHYERRISSVTDRRYNYTSDMAANPNVFQRFHFSNE